jgi:hypothetical protein
MNMKKQRLGPKITAEYSEVDSHSCADVGKTITERQHKMTGFNVYTVQWSYMKTVHFMQTNALTEKGKP